MLGWDLVVDLISSGPTLASFGRRLTTTARNDRRDGKRDRRYSSQDTDEPHLLLFTHTELQGAQRTFRKQASQRDVSSRKHLYRMIIHSIA